MKEYFCNKCGKKMDIFDLQTGVRMHDVLGYGSKYDGSTVNLDLCSQCTDELIDYIKSVGKFNPVVSDEDDAPIDMFDDDCTVSFVGKVRQA